MTPPMISMTQMSIGVANAVLENTVEVVVEEELLDDVLVAVRKRIGV